MKRLSLLFLLLVGLFFCGCAKEKDEAKKAVEKEMEGMTMESVQREGKMAEVPPPFSLPSGPTP